MGIYYKCDCGFVIWMILVVCSVTAKGISVSMGPQNTVIREGETATMECTVDRKGRDTVRWYRVSDGAFAAISRDTDIEGGAAPAAGEYEIAGNHPNGEYNLKITDTDRRDSGEYRCGFEMGPRNDITSEGAELQVVVPPDDISPICIMVPGEGSSSSIPGYYSVGDAVRLECMSSGGVPPAMLRWNRGGTSLTSSMTGTVTLEKAIEISDLDEEFTCYAESLALDAPRSCTLLPAHSPPDVRIMPDSASLPIQGGITFVCEAEGAVPFDSSYRWFLNGNEILDNGRQRFQVSSDTKTLQIERIGESDHGAVIKCELHSPDGLLGQAEASVSVTGVQETSDDQTSTIKSTTPSLSSTPSSSEVTDPFETDNMTHEMPMGLIVVSAVAGLAIGALAIIFIVYIFKKYRKRQATKANRQDRNHPGSISISKPVMAVQPTSQMNGMVEQSEDGYTILRKPNNSGVYEVVGNTALPTAPKLHQTDNDLYWDYEIPYSDDHSRRQTLNASNPIYLEIIE